METDSRHFVQKDDSLALPCKRACMGRIIVLCSEMRALLGLPKILVVLFLFLMECFSLQMLEENN